MIRFGPFQIDPRTWTLAREGQVVDLSPRLVEILAFFASRPGDIITKDELLDRFWPGVNISDNTLTRAIADIRIALGDSATEPRFIQTFARRGYRFLEQGAQHPAHPAHPVHPVHPAHTGDPFEDWVKGRLALETLDAAKLDEAVRAFERAVAELPGYAPAHAGLANGYLLQFEQTRFGRQPDRELLARAVKVARDATAVDPSLGEGWATLGYLLNAAGRLEEGQAAARRATALEPENWRHHYRLAYGTWGEERLRAVDRALALMPGFAPARMLACMVFVARGTMERAEREAAIGAEAQRQHRSDHTPFPAVGFHWLRGMMLASRADREGALACFEEEIASASTHVYGREFAVNAHVAAGYASLAEGDRDAARARFASASAHPKALVGLYAIDRDRAATDAAIADLLRGERQAEAALVTAGALIIDAEIDRAVAGLDRLLVTAPAGPAGWIIPIDPMLAAIHGHPGTQALLAKLAARSA